MIRIRKIGAKGCIVCGRRDFHIHANSEYERALSERRAQLRLF